MGLDPAQTNVNQYQVNLIFSKVADPRNHIKIGVYSIKPAIELFKLPDLFVISTRDLRVLSRC